MSTTGNDTPNTPLPDDDDSSGTSSGTSRKPNQQQPERVAPAPDSADPRIKNT